MCGIAGILSTGGNYQPSLPELQAMSGLLAHRGPDGEGFHLQKNIGLAHTRLSIIDLDTGEQPIHNEDESVWVVFNGEIFNYIELRAQLIRLGHSFYTQTDTEVIVHLFEEYGEDFVTHLNGQFAIALWDDRQQQLLLVRDRVGIAPLFYSQQEGRLLFGSEAKALLAVSDSPPVLNPAVLDQIFSYWAPLPGMSLFEGVQQLPPGTMLIAGKGSMQLRQYWDWQFPLNGTEYHQGSEQDLCAELYDLLEHSTAIRLRADVPVGAYLSGGLDSSALVSLIHGNARLRTFSVGFEEKSLDEGDYQQLMIDHIQADHRSIRCGFNDVAEQFYDAIWFSELPVLRTALAPMKMLSGLVREQGYKVVLTGEGADEVLGGYDIFKEAKVRRFWAQQPGSSWRPLLLKKLYPYLNIASSGSQAFLSNFFSIGLDRPNASCFSHLPRWDTSAKGRQFFNDAQSLSDIDTLAANVEGFLPEASSGWHAFNRSQYIEAKLLMGSYLLCSQGDRMLMANSVEGRFPFLDHRLIEFANKLPPQLKMKVLNEKYLLKKTMTNHLPSAIINRFKQPYRAPDIPGFYDSQGNARAEYVDELLSDRKITEFGYFDARKVSMLVKKARRGAATSIKDNQAFVGILSTQLWHHRFIERFSEYRFRQA